MKTPAYFLALMVIPLGLFSCEKLPGNGTDGPKPFPISQKSKQLVEAGNDFSLDFFREMMLARESGKNLMVSPLSVSLALAMTYNGAGGDTKTAMEEALRVTGMTPEEINQSYAEIMNGLLDLDPKVTLIIANSIWYRNTFPVDNTFIQTNQYYYNAEVSALDFEDPASVNTINNWVNNQTKGKIPTIVDQINPLDILFLINAIYFKGKWKYMFDEQNTSDRLFYPEKGDAKNVPVMHMEADIEYFYSDLAQGIRLPYGQGNFSMILVLPGETGSPGELAENMTTGIWEEWLDNLQTVNKMKIYLPRFKFEFESQLKEILSNMGMGIAFTPGEADFSLINPDFDLYISSVLQKTFIEVNEEGTEAAAATSVTVGITSVGPPDIFDLNRPFLFVIYEQETGAILFMGAVADPEPDS